ncbi:ectoine/hydroxyectoine ABC transporter permease subunit EhuD [Burkholderia sp. WSM2232]|uniref:ectoine/hydroxyectoine ABC transporter permease subunit EhuD n=1 Tax=Burkholderia sp. WSM2232 TaxID=944436 RepID=UPI000482BA79|nr:ectoine/hydroxyectoine ABC transporter permease subunit EhuD [Burkholderia sp. WSM2232]
MNFDWRFAWQILPSLVAGARITVGVTLASFCVALAGGALLLAVTELTPRWVARPLSRITGVIRGTPLLVQVFLFFYMLPDWGVTLGPLWTGVIAFGLHYSCYLYETYRSALLSVRRAQWSAGKALGLTDRQVFVNVVLPQMVPVCVPIAGSFLVYMFKDTPLLAAITVREMMQVASQVGSDNFRYMEPLTIVGLLFLIMSLATSRGIRWVEKRTTRWRQPN